MAHIRPFRRALCHKVAVIKYVSFFIKYQMGFLFLKYSINAKRTKLKKFRFLPYPFHYLTYPSSTALNVILKCQRGIYFRFSRYR